MTSLALSCRYTGFSRPPPTYSQLLALFLTNMGSSNSTPEPPYTGMVYAPKRTFDITSNHGRKLAGVYEIRENGLPHYCTNFIRARRGINISTIHRLEDDGRPGEILAACRGSGHWSTRFGAMSGNPFVERKTKVDRQGKPVPWAKDKKQWPKIDVRTGKNIDYSTYAFRVNDRKFHWERVTDRGYIGSADTRWAHWALIDEEDELKRISAVYVHIIDENEFGQLRVAQFNLYSALGPDVEVMALVVMEGIEKFRGPEAVVPRSSSAAGGGPSSCGGASGGGGSCGGDGGGTCGD